MENEQVIWLGIGGIDRDQNGKDPSTCILFVEHVYGVLLNLPSKTIPQYKKEVTLSH